MNAYIDAARAARRWLLRLDAETPEQNTYRDLGIGLAECVMDSVGCEAPAHASGVDLPPPAEIMTLGREALLSLCRSYTAPAAAHISLADIAFAQLARSYARTDDLQATAAALHLALLAGADSANLGDLWEYLLAQQQTDGSFGLIAAEMAMLACNDTVTPRLALTVDVLRALTAAGERACDAA